MLVRCFPYFSPYNTTYHKVVTCWFAKIGFLARQSHRTYLNHHHHHLSLNSEGCWCTTDDFETSFLHLSCSPLPSFTRRTLNLSFPRCVLPTSSGFETGSEQYLDSDRDVNSDHPLQHISGKIMTDALKDHEGTVIEISAEKTKLMTNNSSGINTEIKVNGQKLETVTSFKCLGSVITDEGSKPEVLSRTAQATAALTRLKPVWIDKSISLSSKIRLMRSLVTSIFLYACESWTLTAELQRRIQAMEMRCYRKILHISYKDHVTNEEVHAKI